MESSELMSADSHPILARILQRSWYRPERHAITRHCARIGGLLFLAFALAYSLLAQFTATNWPLTGDEPHYMAIAESIWQDRDLDLANNPGRCVPDAHVRVMDDGRWRPAHLIGLPLMLALPVRVGGRVGASLVLALVSAATVALTYLLAWQLTGNQPAAILAALALGTTPPFTIYATMIYPETPGAMLLAVSLVAYCATEHRWAPYLVIGLTTAIMPWYVIRFAPLAAVVCLLAVMTAVRHPHPVRNLAACLVPPALSAAGYLLFSRYMYGSWSPLANYGASVIATRPNYLQKWLTGLLGWFFDQRCGLLPFAPHYAFGIAGLFPLWKGTRGSAKPLMVCLGTSVLFSVMLPGFWVQWSPPTRYLTVVLPFLAIGIGYLAAMASRTWMRIGLAAATVFSVGLGVVGYARPTLLYNYALSGSSLYNALPSVRGLSLSDLAPIFPSSRDYQVPPTDSARVEFDLGVAPIRGTYTLLVHLSGEEDEAATMQNGTLCAGVVDSTVPKSCVEIQDPSDQGTGERRTVTIPLGSIPEGSSSISLERLDGKPLAVDSVTVRHIPRRYQGWPLVLVWACAVGCLCLLAWRSPSAPNTLLSSRMVGTLYGAVCILALALLVFLYGRGPGGTTRYEAETMASHVGRIRVDTTAHNWLARVATEPGFVVYGPYVCTPPGDYVATFWVRQGDPYPANAGLAVAEVVADGGAAVLASYELDESGIPSDRYEPVEVPFTTPFDVALETRLKLEANAQLWLDGITVRPVGQ